ncbi:hypothetical protein ABZ876_09510 [Streptomyces sp. NPDC046931]|uniref:hypothetical protein n=1 Tax=Streptomyces sp. NPDC046931 TaxID=3154806 RepID=UPI0034107B25
MQTLTQRYGKKRVWAVIGCAWAVVILVGVVKSVTDDSGPGSWSPAFKEGRKDAYDWSTIYEDPDTALYDCEAGVAHDRVLNELDAKTFGWSDEQLVDWSRGCVSALRDFMPIPKQSWE